MHIVIRTCVHVFIELGSVGDHKLHGIISFFHPAARLMVSSVDDPSPAEISWQMTIVCCIVISPMRLKSLWWWWWCWLFLFRSRPIPSRW